MNTALIIGGNGIIGKALTEHFILEQNWSVLVSSRSPLHYTTKAKYISFDLSKPVEITFEVKEQLKNVTHLFFAAYTERSNPYEQVDANMALLKNLLNAVEPIAKKLTRVIFIQGGKAYGAHLGYYKTPAIETDSRSITPNFYYDQEDFLRKRAEGKTWNWTALRPDIIIGVTVKNAMNMANILAVYATLCKEENIPIRFPGSEKAYHVLVNLTDASLLAKAMQWVSEEESTANEIFNITNGDVFRWSQLWPKIGEFLGVDTASPQPFSLQEYLSGKTELWNTIVTKYNLQPYSLDEMVQWGFGDFIFNVETDAFQDVSKARQFGFHQMNGNTSSLLFDTFKQLQNERLIP